MRYFLIDRVTEYEPGVRAVGIKNVTLTDEILHDHFPDHPMMPGALIVEAMAQLAGFLIETSVNGPESLRRAVFAQIDRAKFHRPAEPGDRIVISATLDQQQEDAAKVVAVATVDGEKAVRATLTFVLRDIDSTAVHDQRRSLYRLWTKHMAQPPQIF